MLPGKPDSVEADPRMLPTKEGEREKYDGKRKRNGKKKNRERKVGRKKKR